MGIWLSAVNEDHVACSQFIFLSVVDQLPRPRETCEKKKGLKPFPAGGVLLQRLQGADLLQMQTAPPAQISNSKYMEKDYLLYSITSASYETRRWIINLPWLKEIRDRLSSEFENEDTNSLKDKYSLSNALADYFRMGYVNYAYTDGVLILTTEF